MTPAKQAKAAGLESLAEVAEITGQSVQTLGNWHREKPKLFKTVIAGASLLKHKDKIIKILSHE
jgi:hypothetical protein